LRVSKVISVKVRKICFDKMSCEAKIMLKHNIKLFVEGAQYEVEKKKFDCYLEEERYLCCSLLA
jgi:hypothetical protein